MLVQPAVVADADTDITIAREEIVLRSAPSSAFDNPTEAMRSRHH